MQRRSLGRSLTGATVLAFLASGVAVADSIKDGERLFRRQCKACHSTEVGGAHRQGPNLHGMFDRKAGTAKGFSKYSSAMESMDLTWDDETLDRYLAEGRAFIPGTTMEMRPMMVKSQRHAIIVYLREATK